MPKGKKKELPPIARMYKPEWWIRNYRQPLSKPENIDKIISTLTEVKNTELKKNAVLGEVIKIMKSNPDDLTVEMIEQIRKLITEDKAPSK